MELFPNKNPDLWKEEDFVLAKMLLHRAGCDCPNVLVGYKPNFGPRCRLCNAVADIERNIIISDVEIFGYKKASFNVPMTDNVGPTANEKWRLYRVHVNMKSYFIIDLGSGRQIRIKFNANKTSLSSWNR